MCNGCDEECEECNIECSRFIPVCTELLDHADSQGGTATLETLLVDEGFWRATNTSRNVLECFNTKACRGGVTGDRDYCMAGYEGPCEQDTVYFAHLNAYHLKRRKQSLRNGENTFFLRFTPCMSPEQIHMFLRDDCECPIRSPPSFCFNTVS